MNPLRAPGYWPDFGHETATYQPRSKNAAAGHSRKATTRPIGHPITCRPRKFCRTACVIGFQHRQKIRSVLIRDTLAPIGTHNASPKVSGEKNPEVVMRAIPLELQRRCEQRWATRFLKPVPTAPQHEFDRKDQELSPPGRAKMIIHLVSSPSLRSSRTG